MNLLITGAWQQAAEYIPQIKTKHNVFFIQREEDPLPCEPERVEGIIGNGIFLHHPVEQFVNLKYIQLTSAGFDRVPTEYVRQKHITINNARGVYSIPMAEYALFGVLAAYKKGRVFLENQKMRKWEKERELRELSGKNVCILGCGSVGTECAKRFSAMGCNVSGIDSAVSKQQGFSRIYGTERIKNVLPESDVVIVTLPLTKETKHIFGGDVFAAMKDGAVFVNIARGAIADTKAMTDKLKTGRIYAVLDVFEDEPLAPESELWALDNVLITPHNSFVGDGNDKRISDLIMGNLEKYDRSGVSGDFPIN